MLMSCTCISWLLGLIQSVSLSVEGDEFIKDSSSFTSNQSATFGQAFSGFSPNSKKGIYYCVPAFTGSERLPRYQLLTSKPKLRMWNDSITSPVRLLYPVSTLLVFSNGENPYD
ncbi:hypothetical protein IFM89_032037 [Coptis chinensis]|uniref:Uncharacterized protein n=1 Tax=Coptis chinensis TaxID=261450 RepID=A0A835LFT3_9MAGN|nr:hypothetical protein IFM89_032037 [Coptis chinensis]